MIISDSSSQQPKSTNIPENLPLVSVIIPCYNQAQYLFESVTSVVNQNYKNWECIIVNDGSPDNTNIVANELIAKYSDKKIILLEKENSGLADTRNFGISNSNGKYILPLDSDDMIKPEMLEKTVFPLESHPEIAIAGPGMEQFGYKSGFCFPTELDLEILRYRNPLLYCSLFRREAWETVGGYNTNMVIGYEDWDFWIACIENSFRYILILEPLLLYRTKENSMYKKAFEHDDELRAQIIFNHPNIYPQEDIIKAEMILGRKLHDPSGFANGT